MSKAILALTVLVAAVLIAPMAVLGHERDGRAIVRIELPVTAGAPTSDCPDTTIFTVDYGISSKGKTGTGRNCIVGFNPVDCAPAICVDLPILMKLSLSGGTIKAEASLFEAARCDASTKPECTIVLQRWSGTVTEATGKFRGLEGGTVSGGGVARYRFPPDPFEPFASVHEALVITEAGDDD